MPEEKKEPPKSIYGGKEYVHYPEGTPTTKIGHKGPNPKCGVMTRSNNKELGEVPHPCKRVAGHGTDHLGEGPCKFHGGTLTVVRVKYLRQKAEEKAAKALKSLGHPFEIHPGQALLDLVYEAAGNVAFLSSEMTKLEGQPLHTNSLEQGEMVRATVKLYGEWSDRLAKVSKMALDAGIDQRMVAIKEREADALLQAIEAITKALNLTPEQIKIARRSAASSFRITSRKVIDMPGVRNPGEVEPGNVAG